MFAQHLAARHASEVAAIESDAEWTDTSEENGQASEVREVNSFELPQLAFVVLECCAAEDADVVPNSCVWLAQLRQQNRLLHRGMQVRVTSVGGHDLIATVVATEVFPLHAAQSEGGQGRAVWNTKIVVTPPRRWLICDDLGRALDQEPGYRDVASFVAQRVSGSGCIACSVNAGDSGELCGDFIRRLADNLNVACLSYSRCSLESIWSVLVSLPAVPLIVVVHGWDHNDVVEELDSEDEHDLVVIRDADGTPVAAEVRDAAPPRRARDLSILTRLCLSHLRHQRVAIVVISSGAHPELTAGVDGPLLALTAVSPQLASVALTAQLHGVRIWGIPVEVAVPHLRGSLQGTLDVCGELSAAAAAATFGRVEEPVLDRQWVDQFFAERRGQVPQQFDEVVGVSPTWEEITRQIVSDTTSSGFCVCGPRGSGKTSCLSAIARAKGFAGISLNIHNSVHGYVGDSAASVRQGLDAATAASPSVIIIDDADCWLGAGGIVEQEIVGQLLGALESTLVPGQIILVVSAARSEELPVALRRRLTVIDILPPTPHEAILLARACGVEHSEASSWIGSMTWIPHRGDLALAAVAH
mmetsp:Transcript_27729/g.62855  ORF Transcript_27729/g.62855 Transcript_27729/m.62855 type:complete len:586 (-) Transcript_27729:184-1941(-)